MLNGLIMHAYFAFNTILTHHRFLWLLCLSIYIISSRCGAMNWQLCDRLKEERAKKRSKKKSKTTTPHQIFYDDFPVEQFLRCWLIKREREKNWHTIEALCFIDIPILLLLFSLHNLLYFFVSVTEKFNDAQKNI